MSEVSLQHIEKVYPYSEKKKSNLKVTDEGVHAVQDFNLNIKDREFIVLVGPSGCGKSTTLRMVAGLEEITRGELYIDGKLVNDVEPKDRDIAMVFQSYALYPHMTVRENLIKPYLLTKPGAADAEEKCMALLEKVGLAEKKDEYPCRLSGGQQQRVAIARALMRDPKVMLFDEPTSALDPQLTGEVLAIMQQLAAEHRTMVVVTHEMSFARGAANRILYVNGGLIAEEGTPEEIFGAPKTAELRAFWGSGFED